MSNRSTLLAATVAALVTLAGCDNLPPRNDPGVENNTLGIKTFVGTTERCTGTTCDVKVNAKVGFWGCAISDIEVTPDILVLTEPNTTIVWHLKGDFAFCPTRGDGVFITTDDPNYQFRDTASVDDEEIPNTGCRKKFRMHGVNDKVTAGQEFKYVLRFRSTSKWRTVCERDPFVRNGR